MSLTPEDVERVTFRSTRLRQGYDEDEVDDLLERVIDAMRAGEPFDYLLETPLALTRMRTGYDPADVDAFLDRLRRVATKVPSGTSPGVADTRPDDGTDAAFSSPETRAGGGRSADESDPYESGADGYGRYETGGVAFGQSEQEVLAAEPEPPVDELEPDAAPTAWNTKPHHFPVPLVADPPPADVAACADGEELAERVLNATFRATRLRSGYEQAEVDRFLDQIAMDLRAGLDVTEQVQTVRFTVVQWQDGYEQDDVDDFLDGFLR